MIIRIIASSRSVAIDDPRNFRAFSVRIEGSMDAVLQDQLLRGIAVSSDGNMLDIREGVARMAFAQIRGMVAGWPSEHDRSGAKFGWIDQANHSIRAHIEHVP